MQMTLMIFLLMLVLVKPKKLQRQGEEVLLKVKP